jgi:hypothetical protein
MYKQMKQHKHINLGAFWLYCPCNLCMLSMNCTATLVNLLRNCIKNVHSFGIIHEGCSKGKNWISLGKKYKYKTLHIEVTRTIFIYIFAILIIIICMQYLDTHTKKINTRNCVVFIKLQDVPKFPYYTCYVDMWTLQTSWLTNWTGQWCSEIVINYPFTIKPAETELWETAPSQ